MKRHYNTRENNQSIGTELQCIPLEIVEKISEEVHDFLIFIAIGLSCRTLLPLLKCNSSDAPIRRLLHRNTQKFRETANFYHRIQSNLVTVYSVVHMMFDYTMEVLLPYNRINFGNNLEKFMRSCNGWLKIMNMDGTPLTLKMLFEYIGSLTITQADKWVTYILKKLDQLLGNRYIRLGISDDKNIHYSPFNGGITLDMVILFGAIDHIL
jgi:hypothetical protein